MLTMPDELSAAEEDFELVVGGFQGTPEEIERQWFEQVYKGRGDSMAQLTWRAVLMGSLLGGILSLTNLYIGLKAGWCFGVAITACILSYASWTGLYRLGLVRSKMTILENNCMQSTASSAGYSTGGTLVAAFAAYVMIHGHCLPIPLTLAWIFFLAVLGVTMAIPMKRQMINIEQLRFPSGIAAAETLRALHSHGEKGTRAAQALGVAGLLAAISNFWADGLGLISSRLDPYSLSTMVKWLNQTVFGKVWIGRTVMFEWDPIFMAAGALTGLRVSASMMLGGTLCWAVFVPILQHQGVIAGSGFRDVVQWTLWGGVACMVTSGLLSFVMQWRSVFRSFRNLGGMFSGAERKAMSEVDALEAPTWWFLAGQVVSLLALAWLAHASFDMPVWQSVVAVLLSFFLALVACRVTGETDVTPIGPLGKVTQLTFGILNPHSMDVNLMSANITAGAATSAADLLTDLKSGYLLGANPRKQFLAQFAGIFVGTVVTVLCFSIMVPNASALGGDQFPAPAAQTWRAVAIAMSNGLESLGPVRIWSIVVGGLIGIILPLLSKAFPRHEKWIPSAAGLGMAWTFQWHLSLLFFLGAVLGEGFARLWPKKAEEYLFPVASGIIAGGALMGVVLIFWENGPQMIKQLLGH
jgi:putative OPT family oligopeptide transporter